MENVTAHFPSKGVDETRIVTHLFPSNKMELVPELFPSNRTNGESNGEIIGEKFTHSSAEAHVNL